MKLIKTFKVVALGCCIVLLYTSCSTIARMVNGVKKPKIETSENIMNWLENEGIRNETTASICPEAFFDYFNMQLGSPLIYYKKNNEFISTEYCNGRYCYRSLPAFLENISPAETGNNTWQKTKVQEDSIIPKDMQDNLYYIKPGDYIFNNLDKHLYDLNGNKLKSLQNINADYLVVIPFSKYMGATIQTSNMRKALAAIKKNTKCRISVLLLNLDKQKWWGKEWNEKIKISI